MAFINKWIEENDLDVLQQYVHIFPPKNVEAWKDLYIKIVKSNRPKFIEWIEKSHELPIKTMVHCQLRYGTPETCYRIFDCMSGDAEMSEFIGTPLFGFNLQSNEVDIIINYYYIHKRMDVPVPVMERLFACLIWNGTNGKIMYRLRRIFYAMIPVLPVWIIQNGSKMIRVQEINNEREVLVYIMVTKKKRSAPPICLLVPDVLKQIHRFIF